jgi:hypothetical protein
MTDASPRFMPKVNDKSLNRADNTTPSDGMPCAAMSEKEQCCQKKIGILSTNQQPRWVALLR